MMAILDHGLSIGSALFVLALYVKAWRMMTKILEQQDEILDWQELHAKNVVTLAVNLSFVNENLITHHEWMSTTGKKAKLNPLPPAPPPDDPWLSVLIEGVSTDS